MWVENRLLAELLWHGMKQLGDDVGNARATEHFLCVWDTKGSSGVTVVSR